MRDVVKQGGAIEGQAQAAAARWRCWPVGRRWRLLVAGMVGTMLLAACAAGAGGNAVGTGSERPRGNVEPPFSGKPTSSAGAGSTPAAPSASTRAPTGSLADPAVREKLNLDLGSRGWQLVSVSQNPDPDKEPNLTFAQYQSVAKVDARTSRVWTVTVLSNARATSSKFASIASLYEVDCPGRTYKPVQTVLYKDRSATDRLQAGPISRGPDAIVPGSNFEQIAQRVCGSTLGAARGPSSGSGVIVAPTMVLTNRHVIDGCGQLDTVRDGVRHASTVVAEDARTDLALVTAPTLDAKARKPSDVLRLRRSATTGEPVLVAGFPLAGLLGADVIVTTGIVNSLSGTANDSTRLQISAPIQPGNSGGPVLDKSGQLVGLVVSKLNALRVAERTGDVAQNVNFAIKPEVLKLFLEAQKVVMPNADVGTRMETEDVAARAVTFTVKLECKPKTATTPTAAAAGSTPGPTPAPPAVPAAGL